MELDFPEYDTLDEVLFVSRFAYEVPHALTFASQVIETLAEFGFQVDTAVLDAE